MSTIYTVDGTPIETGEGGGSEDIAKSKLTGKVMVALGDSYTVGMGGQLTALATKYGMVIDNRGVVGATIAYRSTDANRRMYNTADTIVSDYTSGKTISDTTYYADDVAIITFMGGANDYAAIDNWLGTGTHETASTTIFGSLNHIFSSFQTTFTKAKIICVTQPANFASLVSSLSTDASAQELGFENLAEAQVFNDIQFSNYMHGNKENAVRTIAWWYGIEVVDMFHDFPQMNNPENRSIYWQSDKLHLTADGYSLITNALDKKIVTLFGRNS